MTLTLELRHDHDPPREWHFEAADERAVRKFLPELDDFQVHEDAPDAVLVASDNSGTIGSWSKAGAARLGSLFFRELQGPKWLELREALERTVMDPGL